MKSEVIAGQAYGNAVIGGQVNCIDAGSTETSDRDLLGRQNYIVPLGLFQDEGPQIIVGLARTSRDYRGLAQVILKRIIIHFWRNDLKRGVENTDDGEKSDDCLKGSHSESRSATVETQTARRSNS